MGGCENFVSRWSRLKRKSEAQRKPRSEVVEGATPGSGCRRKRGPPAPRPVARQRSIWQDLPSMNSITAETDVSAFLQPGSPPNWPKPRFGGCGSAIRLFAISSKSPRTSEDFTNPATIPGFGALRGTGDSLLAQAVGMLEGPTDVSQRRFPTPRSLLWGRASHRTIRDARARGRAPATRAASATPTLW